MLKWLKVSLLQSYSNSLTDLLWLTPGETDSGSGTNVWQNSNLKLTSPRFTSVWWTPPGAASGLEFLKNLNESFMSLKAALCDCRTWMCQCVLVLVLVDRPAALWCSDLSLVASFRFTLWSSLFWFCCHVCWWLITVTTPHRRTCSEAARPGSLCCQVALSLYLCLMTASPAPELPGGEQGFL